MLMDAVVNYLPSPLDLPPMKGSSDENEVQVSPDDSSLSWFGLQIND